MIKDKHAINSNIDFLFLFNWFWNLFLMELTIIKEAWKKITSNIMRKLSLVTFLLVACAASIFDCICTRFDARITKSCRNATMLIIITPMTKFMLVNIWSILSRTPITFMTALLRAAKHAMETKININLVASIALTLL